MSKPARFVQRRKLTLQGEKLDIADAHVYAGRQRRTLSGIFFEWLLPRVLKDKAMAPDAYAGLENGSRSALSVKRHARRQKVSRSI